MGKYQSYPGYTKSIADWIGEIPSHWETKRLGALFNRKKETGCTDEELLSVYRDYGVIRKASREDNFNKPSDDLSPYQLVEPGDLVLNKMKTWQGSIAISEHRGIVSPAYFTYRPGKDVYRTILFAKYTHYLVRSPLYVTQYLRLSKGIRVNQWDLDPDNFKILELIIPPRGEQQAIAAFLDHETTKIDRLIARQERLIELLKEKRQAVISHAVTKGLNSDAPMKDPGVEWLGEVPAHWTVSRIKFVVTTPVTDGPHETPEILDEGVPFVSAEAVKDDEIDFSKIRGYISATDHARFSRKYKPKRGDIYMVKSGATTGNIAMVKTDAEFNIWSPLAAMRPNNHLIDGQFLFWFMRSRPFQQSVELGWNYGTQQNIGMNVIENLPILLPPYQEQQVIRDQLDRVAQKYRKLIDRAQHSIELMREHRTALISAAVTGKIDVRGWQKPKTEPQETATAVSA